MTTELSQQECKPCKGEVEPLKGEKLAELQAQLQEGWRVVDEHHLVREFKFDKYGDAVAFTNAVADIAQQQKHHPDITLSYGKVTVKVFTHKIGGLSENDFIFAAKVDDLV